ncbi:chemotaxis protein methyltransferase CheR [Altererythrobacter atlanticus]|uniref:Chemotaxis protein methyltransferase Cher2 n=1 Tax=Croceibacterium atlanticum TaxID=1267766 RepID=A0A0F7KWS8_9SPHN|nr:protein-glutamate O-methyltransferase CheR [Croceibacterium atlanticum]AKH43677.1 Chemotaxis protein methyltransferase Cher2 [Croceibacterium atlanticum]MBB5733839.1 chemotaxis protein methyltransferase CheR [Croceibacterium atlanticum]
MSRNIAENRAPVRGAPLDPNELALGIVAGLLETRTGQRLTADRAWRVAGALSGVLRANGLASIDALGERLKQQGQTALAQQVVEALLNNETSFFRDRALFEQISEQVLPRLQQARTRQRKLSIWSAGCSTGQEAYSLAMLFAGERERWRGWKIEILGTDVSASMVAAAAEATYSQFQVQRGLGAAQMVEWFEEVPTGWRARPELRRMTRFETRNLLEDPPAPGSFDLILCRNVLLYFDAETRRSAFSRLAEALAPDGWLMLGLGETTNGFTDQLVAERNSWAFRHPEEIRSSLPLTTSIRA